MFVYLVFSLLKCCKQINVFCNRRENENFNTCKSKSCISEKMNRFRVKVMVKRLQFVINEGDSD